MRKQTKLVCHLCKTEFYRSSQTKIKKYNFCSRECSKLHLQSLSNKVTTNCGFCNNLVVVTHRDFISSKSGYAFCNRSCSAKYNNKIRKKTRRSKIEIRFGEELQKLFPNLEFIFNDRTILSGLELDIYIPSLKLAIEWNGKVHYQPIYGQEKLNNIQYRDYQKQLLCQKFGIDLIVIADLKSNDEIFQTSIEKVSNIVKINLLQNQTESKLLP